MSLGLQYFLLGCLGAIAPEILRFYRLRRNLKFSWSWGYVLISLLFVLLGGFIAVILEPQNPYTAFYSGVSTPFIINAIAREGEQASSPEAIPVTKDKISTLQSSNTKPKTEQGRNGEKGVSRNDTFSAPRVRKRPRRREAPKLPYQDWFDPNQEKEALERERRRNLGRFFRGL